MNFSNKIKNQITKSHINNGCCKLAFMSAYIRASGSIIMKDNQIGFEISTENVEYANYFNSLISSMYDLSFETNCNQLCLEKINNLSNEASKKLGRITYRYSGSKIVDVLTDLTILSKDSEGIIIEGDINEYLIENECCKIAYVAGSFVGNGSVTVPSMEMNSKTGYHMEFVFNSYAPATDFCEILSELYILPKLIERKNHYIVYIKNYEEIISLLDMMNASEAVEELSNLTYRKYLINNANRVINCETNNLKRQHEASINQIKAISNISNTIGLESLPKQLEEVAIARLENATSSLVDLANILNISRSCLNHRLRKLIEISNTL